jgi:hypothetical protein
LLLFFMQHRRINGYAYHPNRNGDDPVWTDSIPPLNSNHEEADTHLLLHTKHVWHSDNQKSWHWRSGSLHCHATVDWERCLYDDRLRKQISLYTHSGPFIIYTLGGGGDSYVIYKNLVALPPLDDLNVEDPPIKYWEIYTPPLGFGRLC